LSSPVGNFLGHCRGSCASVGIAVVPPLLQTYNVVGRVTGRSKPEPAFWFRSAIHTVSLLFSGSESNRLTSRLFVFWETHSVTSATCRALQLRLYRVLGLCVVRRAEPESDSGSDLRVACPSVLCAES
jgi:hypothetical protein